ncbi:MAG: hypothetical protein LBU27_02040 [Candidatus Peribacteria bacterium]|jgi:hypothetical protein|nr:hypothetical protein [Candidatus Peribacteria bacterium]
MPEKFIQPEASFRPVDWVKEQTKEELDTLRPVVERTSFGKVENGNVVYNMDDVKDYLEKKKDLSWESLTKRNS